MSEKYGIHKYKAVGYEGALNCGELVSKNNLAVLSKTNSFRCTSSRENTNFLLIAGMPLNEPVARGRPFVMNTKSEILQAFADFNSGSFGK